MKKKYESPEVDVIELDEQDIFTTTITSADGKEPPTGEDPNPL